MDNNLKAVNYETQSMSFPRRRESTIFTHCGSPIHVGDDSNVEFRNPKLKGIAPVVRSILKYKKSGTVLDLGCGTGRHSLFLAKRGFKVIALDNNKEKLAELKAKAKTQGLRVSIIKADIERYRFPRKFDIIIATMLLHFLSTKNIEHVICRMKAATKPDGLNVVSGLTDRERNATRKHFFRKNELKGYYRDWKILEYEERLSKAFYSTKKEKFIRQHRAVLIARNT